MFPRLSHKNSVYLIVSAHITGFIGLQWAVSRAFFEFLVPFNLLLTAYLLFGAQKDWKRGFVIFSVLAGLGGFLLEVAGVKTGVIFGQYWYETALGWKVFEVPLTIALNWWVLVYACGIIAEQTHLPTSLKIGIGASLMTFLDIWIEPVAMRFHFWDWAGKVVPIQNYIAWFIASCLLLWAFYALSFQKQNRLAVWVYASQLAFFVGHCMVFLIFSA
jgi:bisanhydrobacterioruberin hydratase